MAELYSGIETVDLRWLDKISGKTEVSLGATAEVAPNDWLPAAVADRLELDNVYVMTIEAQGAYEILGVVSTATGYTLHRAMEGTSAGSWAEGSEIYQAITAHQYSFIINSIASGGGNGDGPTPDTFTFSPLTLSPEH